MEGIITALILWSTTFLFIVIGLYCFYIKFAYIDYFEKRGIPFVRPTYPFGIFTHAITNKRSIPCLIADVYTNFNMHKLIGVFSFCNKQILIRDEEILKNILIKDFDIFQDRGTYYNKEKDPLTAHLFSLEGDCWKYLRSKLSPTFSSGKIKGMHPNIVDCAKMLEEFVKKINTPGHPLEWQAIFIKYGLEVVSTTAFGLNSESLTSENCIFVKMARKVVEPTLARLFGILFMINGEIGRRLNLKLLPQDVSEYFCSVFKNAMHFREEKGIKRNDYLQLLMDLKISENKEPSVNLSEDDLAAQAFVFIVAGSETTASTMSFCLYELAMNPDIQDRLHQELDLLPDLSYDSINNCEYLDMVVCETLRKYPPLGFLTRLCSRTYKIPGTDITIDKGTQVLISVKGLHNDPRHFPEPEIFNPERFSKQNKDLVKPCTYIPFGDGQRYCIGKRFAQVVVKTGLATLLRRYQVCQRKTTLKAPPLKIEPRSFISFVAGGMWLELKNRS